MPQKHRSTQRCPGCWNPLQLWPPKSRDPRIRYAALFNNKQSIQRRGSPQRVNKPVPTPVGFGVLSTVVWSMSFLFLFFLVQAVVMSFYLASTHPGVDPEELGKLAQTLAYDGNLISYANIATALVCCGMIWTVTSRQLQHHAYSYLGVLTFSRNEATYWVLWLGAILLITDLVTIVSGRPTVPEFLQVAWSTADSKLLLCLAMVVAGPIFEELLFRGFLFQGLRSSVLGGSGAVIVTAALWAVMHQQYNLIGVLSVFAMGVVLGFARWRTGSLLLTIALHSMANLVAILQLLLFR